MAQYAKKMLGLCIAACMTVTAAAVGQRLQPAGLDYAGIYALRQAEPELTGSGVRFAIVCRSITYIGDEPQNDYRPNSSHNCLNTSLLTFHDQGRPPSGVSPHSTAICSILLGKDPNAYNQEVGDFSYQGAAPQAQAQICEFRYFLINNVFTHQPPDADIIAAGIGSPFEDWWTRGIESLAEHAGLIVVAGIGNGLNAYDPVLYPAAAANVIGVGVIDSVDTEDLATSLANFSLAEPQLSSFGPTADGRCKPDIVAPGNHLAADGNDPRRYEPTGTWSSFSTPVAAGAIGLLVQKGKTDPNLSHALPPQGEGGNCLIKAVLMNSADKLPYWHKGQLTKDDDHTVPLDYVQGAGMLNALRAYEQLIAGQNEPNEAAQNGWDLNLLQKDTRPQNRYKVTLTKPENKLITATVVWNRHYSESYPFKPQAERDANLRLELWAVNPLDPNSNELLDYSDSGVDNVEHIYCGTDANYTNYEIVVGYSNPNEPNQQYALAWNITDKPNDENILWYDLNTDGVVDELDCTILANNWLTSIQSPQTYLLGDINSDGSIDIRDLQILARHKGLKAGWYKAQP
jgi:hypothetical protein